MATTKKKTILRNEILMIDPSAISCGWRARSDLGDLDDLKGSIIDLGQLQPIVVKPGKVKGRYSLIAGMRRLKVCQKIGEQVPAVVVTPEDDVAEMAMQLAENMKRKDFDVLELSQALERYRGLYEAAHPETKHGAVATVTNLKRGDKLPKVADATTLAKVPRFTSKVANDCNMSETKVRELLAISDLPKKDQERIAAAKTTVERAAVAQDCLRKVRQARKLKALDKQAKASRQLDLDEAGKPPKPPVTLHHGDNKDYFKGEKLYELLLTDPPYERERSLIQHIARASINKKVDWDKLDLGWVLRAAPMLADGGQILAFCPLEALGAYELACEAAGLEYRGALIWHKCISENTLVPVVTEHGLHQLRPDEIQTGDKIISVDENGNSILAGVAGVERMGKRDSLLRITLADGNMAEVTPNHRIPTGQNKLIEAGDLKVGDKVQVATRFPLEEPGSEYKEAHDLGRIIGIWLGDGGFSSTRNSRVEFYLSRMKQETVDFLMEALPRLFEGKVNRYDDGEGIRLYLNCESLRSFVGGMVEGRTSKTKRIRPNVYLQGSSMLQGISDGFCETDGSWDEQNKRWRFNQGNGELLRDVSILLKVLGRPMKIRHERIVDDGTGTMHTCFPAEFRPEPSAHPNATFKPSADGVALVEVVKIDRVDGAVVWDLMVDSPSHLFAVDHGMLVHNSNPAPAHRPVYVPSCEAIVWATKGHYYFLPWEEQSGAISHNYIEGPICQGNERLNHPTQKPAWLIERLLRRHAAVGHRVFDPFAGVATTLAVCKRMGLACTGVEKEDEYVKAARARLAAVK